MTQTDVPDRERLVFGEAIDWESQFGGVVRFGVSDLRDYPALDVSTARKLIETGHLSPSDTQNVSPTAEEFVTYGEETESEYPDRVEVVFDGYVVSPSRDDSRVTIEAVVARVKNGWPALPEEVRADFEQRFGQLHPLNTLETSDRRVRAWWD